VTLIPDERVLLKNGQPVSLTPKAFDLLSVLASNPGRLLTKEQLMRTLWPDTVVEESNLTYHIFAIRKGLGEDGEGERYIETVPKRGYRFIAPVSRADADADADAAPAPTEGVTPSAGPSSAVVAPSTRRRSWVAVGVSLFTGAALVFGVLKMQQSPALSLAGRTAAVRFQDPVKGRLAESETFAVSEDGRRYVYAAEGPDGVLRLWLRTLDSPQPVAIPESEMFTIAPPPVWSPDSRFFAFNPAGVLRKGSVDGGMPQELCAFGTAVGGDWNDEGDILVGNVGGKPVDYWLRLRIDATGSKTRPRRPYLGGRGQRRVGRIYQNRR
jgi:DNA-binding winged helix-turn-helix (wHTH) protein